MKLHTFYFNPFRVCTYILSDDKKNTIIIDCGCSNESEKERLTKYIDNNELQVRYHLLTHAHIDHALGARFIYEKYGCQPYLAQEDVSLFAVLRQQSHAFGLLLEDEPLEASERLEDLFQEGEAIKGLNDAYQLRITQFETSIYVIPTPGHSQGSVCYYLPSENILLSGDTLFQSGFGRTDLPGGNFSTLMQSLHILGLLPAETSVHPGHGYPTTIGAERLR